jgi:HPt (histidine-containing phosphotransfer) domain-containing protein
MLTQAEQDEFGNLAHKLKGGFGQIGSQRQALLCGKLEIYGACIQNRSNDAFLNGAIQQRKEPCGTQII